MKDVLIFDLETATKGKPNPNVDKLRVFGCYSYKTEKSYLLTNKEQIQKIINSHKFLVGFNSDYYDIPILEKAGYDLKYKISIDMKTIFMKRASTMKIKEGMLGDLLLRYSLDFITRTVGIVNDDTAKGEIDYNIFKKATWTKEEIMLIKKYTLRDIEITKKLYEWLENYFEGLKDFINEKDVKSKKYLTLSIAAFAYKAICKKMSWEEEWGDDEYGEKVGGGYVSYPAGEKFEGDIYCWDFNSLYPFTMIQCNLYGRRKNIDNERDFWMGDNWKVNGSYYSDKLSPVCNMLLEWYKQRLEYKKVGDKREYTLKIILNTCYGLLLNPSFKKIYDPIAGGDCTRLGRQWIKYSRKIFNQEGYKVITTDTDSCYIVDPYKDKARMMKVKDKIVNHIKANVPFPNELFDMGIDDEITHMFFFKGKTKEDKESDSEMDELDFINKPKGLLKKNYIYITKDGRVVYKNLGVRKKSTSALTRKIFKEYIIPKILETKEVKYDKSYYKQLISTLLQQDLSVATTRYSVNNINSYSKSPNGIYAQISLKYGEGIHFLIPNTKMVGIGKYKDKRLCTLEEFKEHNFTIDDIDLSNVYRELEYFTKPKKVVNIFSFGKKKE